MPVRDSEHTESRIGMKEDRQYRICYCGIQEINPETKEGKDSEDGNVEDMTLTQARTEKSRKTSTRTDCDGKSKQVSSGRRHTQLFRSSF